MSPMIRTLVRWILGIVFILYGLTKFFRMQAFDTPVDGLLVQELSSSQLFWYFFGYSDLYLWYLGVLECAIGLLLIVPLTQRIGAVFSTGLTANIALLDFIYDIGPVKYWVSFLCLVSVLLIATERAPYVNAFRALLVRPESSQQ